VTIARYAVLAITAPVLLAATFGDPNDELGVPGREAAAAQERNELAAQCRSLIAMFDAAARTRTDSDGLQSALRLRTTAANECSDSDSPSLVENGIDDLHMALHLIGAEDD
jgi:hypothetical protein